MLEMAKYGERMKTGLRKIPGVGKETEKDLIVMGYTSIESLKGQNPQSMYDQHCSMKGCRVDRCQLYVFRCAVYFADNEIHKPEKLKWWNWKD